MDPNEEFNTEELKAITEPNYTDLLDDDDDDEGVEAPEEQSVSQEEPSEEKDAEEKKSSMVPHGALHEERTKRQEIEQRYQQLEQQNTQLMERFDRLLQRFDQPQPQQQKEPEQIPDKEQDPFGYMQWLENQVNELKQGQEKQTQQQTEQQQMQAIWQEGNRQASEFRSQTPDYDQAFEYLYQKRGEELIAMGTPKERVATILQQEAWQGMQYALANKINPGQMVYSMAQSRGYTKQEGTVDPETAMKANRSMSGSGRSTDTEASMNDIINMTDEEYEKWLDKNGDAGLAKMHGLG
jgi:chromosome segregation ATPase